MYFCYVNAQSRCSSICELTPDCKNGKCSISRCWEREGCFQFCLDCSGEKACIQSGELCPKNVTSIPFVIQYNSSKNFETNFRLFMPYIIIIILYLR